MPSKALIRSYRAAYDAAHGSPFGVRVTVGAVDFGGSMERMRRLRAGIAHNDSAKRFSEAGVDVFLGQGAFAGPDELRVGDARLRFSRAVIATGSRAANLAIPGLAEVGFLTNETVFALTELPKRLLVIRHAGEMIGEVVLAITEKAKVGALSRTIQPYPTQAEAWKRLGDAYQRTRLTPGVLRLFRRLLACRR
jgi:pyruvate/2-oxoglutarate dehydrogenase complex dihydrolipoamide dehydrogenase (E3) component